MLLFFENKHISFLAKMRTKALIHQYRPKFFFLNLNLKFNSFHFSLELKTSF